MRQFHGVVGVAARREEALDAFLSVPSLMFAFQAEEARVQRRRDGVWSLAWTATPGGHTVRASGTIAFLERHLEVRNLTYRRGEEEVPGTFRLRVRFQGRKGSTVAMVTEDGYHEGGPSDALRAETTLAWRSALPRLKAMLEGDVDGVGYVLDPALRASVANGRPRPLPAGGPRP